MARLHCARTLMLLVAAALPACGVGAAVDPGTPSAPSVVAAEPTAGFTPGGTSVTLTGTDLSGTTAVSFDGAAAVDVTVIDDTTITCTTPPGVAGAADIEVIAAAGTATANVFTYIAYPPSAAPDVQVDHEGPVNETRSAGAPAICCEGPNVYVVWMSESQILFQRSTDRGATWAPLDVRLDTSDVGDSINPQICCSDGNVYVAWFDSRNDAGAALPKRGVYANRSTDGGATWLAGDSEVSPGVARISSLLEMCCEGQAVHVAWADQRDPLQGSIFANSSSDAGATWRAEDARVSTAGITQTNITYQYGQHQICCSGNNVYVSFPDTRNGTDADLWCTRSTDGGASWSPEVRVDRDVSGRHAGLASPASRSHTMCCDGSLVYVVWRDNREAATAITVGAWDLYANLSDDGGLTFQPTDVRVSATALAADGYGALHVRIRCSGSELHVTWSDDRSGDGHVYYNRSLDGGSSFQALDTRIDPGGTGAVTGPYLALGQGHVHITWSDARTSGQEDVFINSSSDGGGTWLASGVRLDSDLPATGDSELPREVGGNGGEQPLCCDGARAYVVWRDTRNQMPGQQPPYDIYFGTYE